MTSAGSKPSLDRATDWSQSVMLPAARPPRPGEEDAALPVHQGQEHQSSLRSTDSVEGEVLPRPDWASQQLEASYGGLHVGKSPSHRPPGSGCKCPASPPAVSLR